MFKKILEKIKKSGESYNIIIKLEDEELSFKYLGEGMENPDYFVEISDTHILFIDKLILIKLEEIIFLRAEFIEPKGD